MRRSNRADVVCAPAPAGPAPGSAMQGRHALRIAPGSRRQIGWLNYGITRAMGLANGGHPPNVFTTLARNRRLFRRWLWFAAALMPGGSLPRDDTELVILRMAHNTGCEYEWGHHGAPGLGVRASAGRRSLGFGRVLTATGWSERRRLLRERRR